MYQIQSTIKFFKKLNMLKFLKNPYFHLACYSLALTSLVSASVALGLYHWFPFFLEIFLITSALQFIVFFVVNTVLQRRDYVREQEFLTREAGKEIFVNSKLACAYCKQTSEVKVSFMRENTFMCDFCKLENGVKIQLLSTQTIKPVENVTTKIIEAAGAV